MTIETVAVVAPGDMGHAVAAVLAGNGLRVITCLAGRSQDSAARAGRAGLAAVPTLDDLVREADAFLSILPPSQAMALAETTAASLARTGSTLLYVDCNAVAPETVRRIGAVIAAASARFVDAGIIGAPPRPGGTPPRFYASGSSADEFAALGRHGLDIRVVGREVGEASALKMCFAAMSKGVTALATEALTAAHLLGVAAPMRAELAATVPGLLDYAVRAVPSMPPKAYRWIGEMEEIAATFASVGLPPGMLLGAADLYRFVGDTPLGRERTEDRVQGTTLEDVTAGLAKALVRD